jgi:hypothetical protein
MNYPKKRGNKGWDVAVHMGQQVRDPHSKLIHIPAVLMYFNAGSQRKRLANALGAEAFWPMTLDKECEKAVGILRSFTKDGCQLKTTVEGEGQHTRLLVKIPRKVLQQAKGLAIFTIFRTGLKASGAGGSGVLVARQPDGSAYSLPHSFNL